MLGGVDARTTEKAAQIRGAVRALGKRGPGRRYPEKLKSEVPAYLGERRRAGRGRASAAAELGIPERSIKLWSAAPRPSGNASFVPVTVSGPEVAPGVRPCITVHAPGGVRIEGLDVAGVAELLRRLA